MFDRFFRRDDEATRSQSGLGLGLSIVDQFPTEGFPSFSTGLALQTFEIGAGIEPLTLTFLSAELGLVGNSTWQPIGDLLTFRELSANVLLLNPLADPSASVAVSRTVGQSSPVRMISRALISERPSAPAGCRFA